jgi:polysaccharide pyruvyl transferase WcaK-like protein/predicted TPR repeat methyltransferase
MRILITDSFCSSNRGDAAILDGMLTGLRERGACVEVVSHFPAVTNRFHDVTALDEADRCGVALAVSRADLVVSCGGSFLHDLYAPNLNPRLATLHLATRLGKPWVIFGQSIGPLTHPLSRKAVRDVLDGAALVCVRDVASAQVVGDLGVSAPIRVGVDAAVGGRVIPAAGGNGPLLGVTVRSWHFPGRREGPAYQERYEAAVAQAADRWARATGGQVRFFSNCTSYGGYRQDDRVAARRVASRMQTDAEVVEAVDLDFATLRGECGACDLFLGTRMHSLVFATTAGVPAVGIAYEDKTWGWLAQVGLEGRGVSIEDCTGLDELLLRTWAERDELRPRIVERVDALRATAEEDLDLVMRLAAGERLPRCAAVRRADPGWNGETWRFDVAHRRLRLVADIVLAEGGERVLDLGCSTGKLGRMLGPTYDYTGVDVAPSVATDRPRFHIATSTLDAWSPKRRYDVVTASGSLEYVDDLEGLLGRIRDALEPGGLAVLTLFNLAHFSRALGSRHRHPDWTLRAHPDDFVLALAEAGLAPQRILATTAGYGPAPAVADERPTDFDLDGPRALPPERLLRLGHHWVVVCRAGERRPGPRALAAAFHKGDHTGALRIAVDLVKVWPWAARAWSDLAVAWNAVGRNDRAAEAALRAWRLDPHRPEAAENLDVMGITPTTDDLEVRVMVEPEVKAHRNALVAELIARGQLHAAAAVQRYGADRAAVAAK